MSGILGVWNSQKTTPWQKMLDDLTVLGPDGQGDWCDRAVGLHLGRTQFFNTPESCLEAPVVEYEGCVLVWDGRLDDRESLLGGRSQVTDAYLIIEAYHRWGIDCLNHLIGEYAFILWDPSQDRLFAGCDVMGSNTIAYYWDGQTLLFSSRVVTLLLHPQVPKELDEVYIAHTVCDFWTHPPGMTAFRGVKRLRPGYALTLQAGHLREYAVVQLESPSQYSALQSEDTYYEHFWDLLNRSVKDRLRNCRPAYITLSGGLDSSTVAVSLLNHLPGIDAFSMVSNVYPEFDEREPIQAFLAQYPQVNWHPINCDDAWALSEPWDRLPVVDDPFITCVMPANFRTMEQAHQQGFGVGFSGVWGDQFCYTLLQDHITAGNWKVILEQLKLENRLHSFVWRYFILPHLPQTWQTRWVTARSPRIRLPEWLQPNYAQSSAVQTAIQQRFQTSLMHRRVDAIRDTAANSSSLGSSQVYRLLAATLHIESTAPFSDRRLIEFANDLHPAMQVDSTYEKIFLRRANRQTLPDSVRLRPKINYFDPLKYLGLCQSEQPWFLLEQAQKQPFLQTLINFDCFEKSLSEYQQHFQNNYVPGQYFNSFLSNQLLYSLTFFNWFLRIKNHYLHTV